MNIDNLLREIDSEKEKMASYVELCDTEIVGKYYQRDFLSLFPFMSLSAGLVIYGANNNITNFAYILFTLFCTFSPFIPLILSCFKQENLSFSYHIMNFFNKEKLENDVNSEKKKIASTKQISNEFLKRMALNMTKNEFKDFLKECDGDITLDRAEQLVDVKSKEQKKLENIDKLTDAIFKENEDLSLEYMNKINQ